MQSSGPIAPAFWFTRSESGKPLKARFATAHRKIELARLLRACGHINLVSVLSTPRARVRHWKIAPVLSAIARDESVRYLAFSAAAQWVYFLLHNQRTTLLKLMLYIKGNGHIIVADVPCCLREVSALYAEHPVILGLMKSKLIPSIVSVLIGTSVLPSQTTPRRPIPEQPRGAREPTVPGISGVIAANARWTLVWQGTNGSIASEPMADFTQLHGANADGIVRTSDGGILFAQEQTSEVLKLDKNGNVSVYLRDTHGTGALAVDSKGRILGVERTCTDPGGNPRECKEPTAVAILAPERKVLADNFQGKSLGRLNDLIIDKRGGVYFNGAGTYYVDPGGTVSSVGENIRTNGIMLSRDEKTFYATNGTTLVVFDVQPDGTCTNQREFAKLEGGGNGDGMAIDSAGRLYVSSEPGVQVFSPEGKYLGLIPTPRAVISAAFSGPDKKTLYVVGSGGLAPDGKEFTPPPGVRNNAKTIYKITMLAQGFKGRVK